MNISQVKKNELLRDLEYISLQLKHMTQKKAFYDQEFGVAATATIFNEIQARRLKLTIEINTISELLEDY